MVIKIFPRFPLLEKIQANFSGYVLDSAFYLMPPALCLAPRV